ncbi:PREDICTED: fibropellin-3-like [Priapulus caudatus]|uniref:Fibropellin-3-like n=1 Tax=Priapulus caudatus TaxID=37621 RepID=A0ABM1DQT3_PRICU|nr:PREDICTED: fibropellin-3-like [Priapulus caudatus]
MNRGWCKNRLLPTDSYSYDCVCQPPFTGRNCDEGVDTGVTSQGKGSAINSKPHTQPLAVTLETGPCRSNPCPRDRVCTADDRGRYTCDCPVGMTGSDCSTDINECDSSPCPRDRQCVDRVGGFFCDCKPGFTGNNCDTEIDECASEPCRNGGRCTNKVNSYACTCRAGYTGVNCQIAGTSTFLRRKCRSHALMHTGAPPGCQEFVLADMEALLSAVFKGNPPLHLLQPRVNNGMKDCETAKTIGVEIRA